MYHLTLTIPFENEKKAKATLDAISPENKGFAEARLEGNNLIITMSSENPSTLRNSADDLLACIKAADSFRF